MTNEEIQRVTRSLSNDTECVIELITEPGKSVRANIVAIHVVWIPAMQRQVIRFIGSES
jgi:hypothetical protein